jgi:hypothetical protein
MRLFSAKSKTGEFLSQSVFRAKLCAWKTSIDSSIQAQESGEVMRRKWRGYGNSYTQLSPSVRGPMTDDKPAITTDNTGLSCKGVESSFPSPPAPAGIMSRGSMRMP